MLHFCHNYRKYEEKILFTLEGKILRVEFNVKKQSNVGNDVFAKKKDKKDQSIGLRAKSLMDDFLNQEIDR